MNSIKLPLIFYVSIILYQNYSTAWILPMLRRNEISNEKSAENLQWNATAEDFKEVIGIQIVKFTRQDSVMKMFDFDMDLARKFAYKQWQKLLSVYEPSPSLQVTEVTVRVPARDPPKTSEKPESKLMKSIKPAKLEYDEDGPKQVAQALQDLKGPDNVPKGLK
uniref:Uncharacterized protein n=1 Tax=Bactrocera dorsalis TaxID=27457 RepID=A0A034UWY2_BACDO